MAQTAADVLKIGYRPHAEIVRMVEAGEVEDIAGAAVPADAAQTVDRADCIMASPGVTREEAERVGFRHAATAAEAPTTAFEKQGESATVAVLRHGGHILPPIEEEAEAA